MYERAYQEQLAIERAKQQAEPAAALDESDEGIMPPPDMYGQAVPEDVYGGGESQVKEFDPLHEQFPGVVLGIAICSQRMRDETGEVQDYYFCRPGDDVHLTLPNAGSPPRPVDATFTVVDLYESKMSEYDSSFAFVSLDVMQDLRGMIDPQSGIASVTAIQIKLKPGARLNDVRNRLQARFPIGEYPYRIQTWKDMQGPLLAAVQLETTILNILLFLIIAVAGFGILATFFMIVVEKTRDVGILKALGAPSRGVMSIFLSYGFALGVVGSGVGMVLGLLFVANINEVAAGLEWITGREVFDPTVYYFREIPTIVRAHMVFGVVAGAVMIAVLASVLPARHAARLHPVEALRYE
jgi:lipoprotein-releasing system permease protein